MLTPLRTWHRSARQTVSNTLKCMKLWNRLCWCCSCFSMITRLLRICSTVLSLKPACSSASSFSVLPLSRLIITQSMILLGWLIMLMVCWFWLCLRLLFVLALESVDNNKACYIFLTTLDTQPASWPDKHGSLHSHIFHSCQKSCCIHVVESKPLKLGRQSFFFPDFCFVFWCPTLFLLLLLSMHFYTKILLHDTHSHACIHTHTHTCTAVSLVEPGVNLWAAA